MSQKLFDHCLKQEAQRRSSASVSSKAPGSRSYDISRRGTILSDTEPWGSTLDQCQQSGSKFSFKVGSPCHDSNELGRQEMLLKAGLPEVWGRWRAGPASLWSLHYPVPRLGVRGPTPATCGPHVYEKTLPDSHSLSHPCSPSPLMRLKDTVGSSSGRSLSDDETHTKTREP